MIKQLGIYTILFLFTCVAKKKIAKKKTQQLQHLKWVGGASPMRPLQKKKSLSLINNMGTMWALQLAGVGEVKLDTGNVHSYNEDIWIRWRSLSKIRLDRQTI